MKFFIHYDDDVYSGIYTVDDFELEFLEVFDYYMEKEFNGESTMSWSMSADYAYQSFYVIETKLSIEQIKKVVEHEFLYQHHDIFKALGNVKEICTFGG